MCLVLIAVVIWYSEGEKMDVRFMAVAPTPIVNGLLGRAHSHLLARLAEAC